MTRVGAIGSKAKLIKGTIAIDTIVLGLAKKTGGILTMGSNRAWSNRRSQENECSNSALQSEDRVFVKEPIYYGYG